jgi:hypothetical protein
MASYLKLIQKGIEGEITPEKLADFHEAYEIAESHIDAKLRQPTEAKVEMITRIALSDPAIRQLYLLDIKAKAPTTMAQAIEYVDAILKTNVRIAELDTINNGSVGAALAATRAAEDTRVAELEDRHARDCSRQTRKAPLQTHHERALRAYLRVHAPLRRPALA